MSKNAENCPRCDIHSKLRTRDFSDSALAALIAWGELDKKLVSSAICDECYGELRETLIERQTEVEQPGKGTSKVGTKKVS